jgi:hypothetical protein
MATTAGRARRHYRDLERGRWSFTFAAAADNLIRSPKLLRAAASTREGPPRTRDRGRLALVRSPSGRGTRYRPSRVTDAHRRHRRRRQQPAGGARSAEDSCR